MISVGNTAQSCIALRRRSAWSMSSVGLKPSAAPTIDTADRTPSITVWLERASAGSRSRIASGTARSGRISSMNAARSAPVGRWPSNMRCHTSSRCSLSASSTASYCR